MDWIGELLSAQDCAGKGRNAENPTSYSKGPLLSCLTPCGVLIPYLLLSAECHEVLIMPGPGSSTISGSESRLVQAGNLCRGTLGDYAR